MVSRLCCLVCGLFFLTIPMLLQGEILEVKVTWGSAFCNPQCASLLQSRFQEMPQVDLAETNASSGITKLTWKSGTPFSYHPIKRTMQSVGVGIHLVSLKVRGEVKSLGKKVALKSLGDGTTFTLIDPLPNAMSRVENPNPYFRDLNPLIKKKLLKEAEEGKIFVMTGWIYRPAASPSLYLILERIQIESPSNK